MYFTAMLQCSCFLILISVGTLETTQVRRIKPTSMSRETLYRPGENTWNTNANTHQAQPVYEEEYTTKQFPLSYTNAHSSSTPTALDVRRNCEKAYSCVNCTTYRLCVPSDQGLIEFSTGSCPSDRPYCDDYSGTCVNSVLAAVHCANPDKGFHCMQDSYFPHPTDPEKYFICSGLKAYGFSCKDGLRFYAPSQGCSAFPWINNPFDCSGMNATKVPYSSGGSYYAYCVNGQPYLINSCMENEFFNTTSQVCEPQCTIESTYPDSNNCLKYFKCFKNRTTLTFEKVSLTCPSGEGYSTGIGKCLPLNQLPSCSPVL